MPWDNPRLSYRLFVVIFPTGLWKWDTSTCLPMTSHICLQYKHVYLYYSLLLARVWKGKYKSPPPFRSIRLLWHPASNDGACVTQHFPRTSNPWPLWPRGNPKETQIKPHSAFLVSEWGGGGSLSWLPTPFSIRLVDSRGECVTDEILAAWRPIAAPLSQCVMR